MRERLRGRQGQRERERERERQRQRQRQREREREILTKSEHFKLELDIWRAEVETSELEHQKKLK